MFCLDLQGVPPFSSPYLIKPAKPLVYMANLNMTSAVMAKNMTSVYKSSSLGNLRKDREHKETPRWDMTSYTKEDARSLYEGIALSNTYLYDYYSQVRDCHHPPNNAKPCTTEQHVYTALFRLLNAFGFTLFSQQIIVTAFESNHFKTLCIFGLITTIHMYLKCHFSLKKKH